MSDGTEIPEIDDRAKSSNIVHLFGKIHGDMIVDMKDSIVATQLISDPYDSNYTPINKLKITTGGVAGKVQVKMERSEVFTSGSRNATDHQNREHGNERTLDMGLWTPDLKDDDTSEDESDDCVKSSNILHLFGKIGGDFIVDMKDSIVAAQLGSHPFNSNGTTKNEVKIAVGGVSGKVQVKMERSEVFAKGNRKVTDRQNHTLGNEKTLYMELLTSALSDDNASEGKFDVIDME